MCAKKIEPIDAINEDVRKMYLFMHDLFRKEYELYEAEGLDEARMFGFLEIANEALNDFIFETSRLLEKNEEEE